MNGFDAYRDLEAHFKKLNTIGDALSVLHWDASVMMPAGGSQARGDQLATLRGISHELLTDPKVGDLIGAAESAALDPWQAANLHEIRRSYRRASAVPQHLVEALSKTTSACEHVWRTAKQEADFAKVAPLLQEVLDLTREEGAILGDALGLQAYDALIDTYEPGASASAIAAIFEDYAAFLPGFLGEVLEKQKQAGPKTVPQGPFAVDRQEALARRLAETVGFDFSSGRMDVSAHPFSTGYAGDRRITVSYNVDDPILALMAALHETGHALYEQNLPAEWTGQPVGRARGMAIHESQSLLIEMQACRTPEFVSFLAPLFREAYGQQEAFEEANLLRIYHWVEPGFIRVMADEVTYPAHVILRFRLEQALLSGDLPLNDLPGAWNEGMEGLLGITPPNDRLGCLQDIHWYAGSFGYFPTYTLGAMTAAQLFRAATKAEPDILPGLASGDFSSLRAWLKDNVHGLGSSVSSDEIVTHATGHSLDPKAFEAHLRQRYLPH
ncbi:carboxypeptidase M32 [Hwanghaeella sp.]|uniref:carboxypeptidase M32 n=1 Tax=Hwanghaeella sp. TaxID=2605943 RepID=UPI003CCC00ED